MPTILITGAGRGIGLELARQLAERGDTVIGVCRKPSAALAATGAEVIDGVDVSTDAGIAALTGAMAGRQLDVLINNAGILTGESLDDLDLDRIRRQFEVNALGPLRVTAALRSCLGAGGKVAIISSRVGSMGDNGSGGMYGYRMSKAAVNMAGVNLALDLKDDGITVTILHPGMVATEMTGGRGIPIPESAANLIARIDAMGPEDAGKFYHAEGQELPW
ncbi:MAG: SDR family oxidoreductase [Gammaproteobacteria bacterium]|nr:SDR family oxidoreductase [Gammaproteobacteria bacterium]NNL99478.1 SDR family oxidoreductase [Gammaproteobacteria bacterium]